MATWLAILYLKQIGMLVPEWLCCSSFTYFVGYKPKGKNYNLYDLIIQTLVNCMDPFSSQDKILLIFDITHGYEQP